MHYMSLTLAYIFCYPLTFPIQPAVQLYIEGALVWLCKMNKSAATSCWDEGWVIRCVMKTISVRPLVHLSEGSVVCRLRVKIPAPFKKNPHFPIAFQPTHPTHFISVGLPFRTYLLFQIFICSCPVCMK